MRMQPLHYWKNDLKKIQALNGIGTHDLCFTDAMLYQLSYQSHMRAALQGRTQTRPLLYSFDTFVGRALHR